MVIVPVISRPTSSSSRTTRSRTTSRSTSSGTSIGNRSLLRSKDVSVLVSPVA